VLTTVGIDYGNYEIVDLGTGKIPAALLLERESPVEWDQDGRHVFVARTTRKQHLAPGKWGNRKLVSHLSVFPLTRTLGGCMRT
jgi:hypothetical protein